MTNSDKSPRSITQWYGWLVCALAALFYCYEYLLRIQPSLMVPQLMQNFHIDAKGLGILSAMYYWAYTPLQAVVGIIIDYYGSRRVLVMAIVLCAVGSFLFGFTQDVYAANVGRLMVGFGSAFAFIGVLKLASVWLPHNRFAFFVGITTAIGMLGAMVGEVNMAWAVQNYGWQRVVMMGVVMGMVLVPIFLLFVYEPEFGDGEVDGSGWTLKQTLERFLVLIKNRQILLAGVIGCLLYLSLSTFAELWGVAFIQSGTHSSLVRAAEINSMVFLGWLVGSPFHGWLSDLLQLRRPQLIIGSLLTGICITFILIWPAMPQLVLFGLLFLFGFFASAEVLCFAVARDITSSHSVGTAMALVNFLVMLSGMIFQPLVGMLLDAFFVAGPGHVYSTSAYRLALTFIPISTVIAAILAWYLRETYRDEELGLVES